MTCLQLSRFFILVIQQFVVLLDEAMLLMAELVSVKMWIPGVGDSEAYIADRAFKIPYSWAENILDPSVRCQNSDKLRSGMKTAQVEVGGILISMPSV